MYLKKKKEADGDIYLSVMEKYYDSKNKVTRERTIKGIGHVSQLKKEHDDPIAYYTQYAKELTERVKEERSLTITIEKDEIMSEGTNDIRNVGYGVLKELYRSLRLDYFWNWKTRGKKIQFSTDQIFRLLTFSRTRTSFLSPLMVFLSMISTMPWTSSLIIRWLFRNGYMRIHRKYLSGICPYPISTAPTITSI